MRLLGILLIIIGAVLLLSGGISIETNKKVAEIGPVEISKKETKQVHWPAYAGGAVMLSGLCLAIWGGRKKQGIR